MEKACNSPQGVRFSDVVVLAEAFGHRLDRRHGSDRIYRRLRVPVHPNIQPEHSGKVKPYQVKELPRDAAYGIELEDGT